jgi:hypothetical protein
VIIGVTGTRKGQAATQLINASGVLKQYRKQGAVWMHHGDCVGSDDEMARTWKAFGGKLHGHPPSNPVLRAFLRSDAEEQPKYYLNRNRDIVNDSDILIATPAEMTEQNRGGTWSTIRYARMKGKRLLIILPDGSLRKENWSTPPLGD